MSNNQQKDTRTASQRLDDMERGLMALYQTADNMARDMQIIKEAIKLLGNKLDSVVKASSQGLQLNDEVISKIMVDNNIQELKDKVTKLVDDKVLEQTDVVTTNSFVVGREIAEDGSIANPRMQFVVSALAEPVKNKFPGQKVGDILTLEEGKWKFEIQEIYSLVIPKAPEAAPAAEAAPASDSTPVQS